MYYMRLEGILFHKTSFHLFLCVQVHILDPHKNVFLDLFSEKRETLFFLFFHNAHIQIPMFLVQFLRAYRPHDCYRLISN